MPHIEMDEFIINHLTVFLGLISAILKASSNAFSNGLQMTGDLGSGESALVSESIPLLTSGTFNSSDSWPSEILLLWVGFNDSKQTILSKQSSIPSILSTVATWASFAFENICHRHRNFVK